MESLILSTEHAILNSETRTSKGPHMQCILLAPRIHAWLDEPLVWIGSRLKE